MRVTIQRGLLFGALLPLGLLACSSGGGDAGAPADASATSDAALAQDAAPADAAMLADAGTVDASVDAGTGDARAV